MNAKKITLAMLACVLGVVCAAVPAFADSVIYDNTNGITDYTNFTPAGQGAYTVNYGMQTVNSFTVGGSGANIDAFNFAAVFMDDTDTLTSLTWAITATPFGTPIASGTTTDFASTTPAGLVFDYYPANIETVNLGSSKYYAPGTYWLEFDDASTSEANLLMWAESDGASAAQQLYAGADQGPMGSEGFQILGAAAVVPEPPLFLLFGTGLLALAAFGHRRLGAQMM